MVGSLLVLVIVIAVASAAGFALRQRQGRFRPQKSKSSGGTDRADSLRQNAARPVSRPFAGRAPGGYGGRGRWGAGAAHAGSPLPRETTVLTAADLGAPLGERATLVQFSTEFCTYCGPTRELLTEVARDREGVAFVEIDAARRMDLTRRLRVMSTPTVLVLDSGGAIGRRTSGPPRKPDLLAAVGAVLGPGGTP